MAKSKRPRSRVPWRTVDDAEMMRLIDQGLTGTQIAARMGRSVSSVHNRRHHLRVAARPWQMQRPWAPEDARRLVMMVGDQGGPDACDWLDIARQLSRTHKACRVKFKVLSGEADGLDADDAPRHGGRIWAPHLQSRAEREAAARAVVRMLRRHGIGRAAA